MLTTLILEPKDYSIKALAIYKKLGLVYLTTELKKNEIKEILGKTNILVVRLANKINKVLMGQMPHLQVIASPTTGLNHIDADEVRRRGIKLVSLRGRTSFLKYIPSTAEETIALILALVKNIPWSFDDVKRGKWDRDSFRGHQLIGKTLGLIGLGRLGKIVARYAKAFGMKVIASDPNVSRNVMLQRGVKKVSLDELCKASDIVSLHTSYSPQNGKFFGRKFFRIMKPEAYFINTARGELTDERALLEALNKKWIKGAAIDVMTNERGNGSHLRGNPLLTYARKHRNLLIVPHLGGATYEAMQITEDFIANLVLEHFRKSRRY